MLNNRLLSLPHCSMDHQVCSHVHSTRATEVTTTQATISVTSNSPKVPLQRQRVTSAGQSLQTNTERAAQHTAGAKLCKPSCLHCFPLWKRERTKTRGTELRAAPEREGSGGALSCRHSTEPTEANHTARWTMRAHTAPARGGQGTDCARHFSHTTPGDNTKATDCTSTEGQHSH